MTAYGLLGRSLSHSFSPSIHRALGNDDYGLFEQKPETLAEFLAQPELKGLNVTIPYKEAVMAYCANLSPRARAIGAVNTMLRQKDGSWLGHNTDYDGFQLLLDILDVKPQGKEVVLLGNGATAKTVSAVLEDAGAHITRLARRRDPHFEKLQDLPQTKLIVNSTPVGMYPDCPERLVSLKGLEELEAIIDVVYNPRRTGLLLDAMDRGLPAIDGLPMLVGQAIAAAVLFQGEDLWPRYPDILASLRLQSDNIVLLGMPGSGKTKVGRTLAKKTGRPFVDCDDLFTERHGHPKDFIPSYGEAAFREKESEIVAEIGKEHGLIIATGGGVVCRPENRDPLWQNGTCYFLDRPLEQLATSSRPLSQGGPGHLQKLYEKRLAAYRAFSHVHISQNDYRQSANRIWEDFHARAHS